jgi:hypothetical protein
VDLEQAGASPVDHPNDEYLPVAQWLVRSPDKRVMSVRFAPGGPVIEAEVAEARGCGPRVSGCESRRSPQLRVAQEPEHLPWEQGVGGAIPPT